MKLSVHVSIDGVAVTDHQRCLRVSWLLWTVLTPWLSVLNTTRTRAAGVVQSQHKHTTPGSPLWVEDGNSLEQCDVNSGEMFCFNYIPTIFVKIRTSGVFRIIDVSQCDCSSSDIIVINVFAMFVG